MPDTLRGREMILAGGTGGLGSVTLRQLAAEGARLTASYRSAEQRAQQYSAVATIVQADITRTEDRKRLLDNAGNLYGLVVFTGDPSRGANIEDSIRISHEANYAGPILLAREAAERMKTAGTPGSIVLFSTMQGVALFPGSTAYAGAKAALIHAARILAKECRGPANIGVNVICPGVNQAGMAEASIAAGKYEKYLTENIIPRYGRAEGVAPSGPFLLEPGNYNSH